MSKFTRLHFLLILIVFCVLTYGMYLLLECNKYVDYRCLTNKHRKDKISQNNSQPSNNEYHLNSNIGYKFHAGLESPGGNMLISISSPQDVKTLEKVCHSTVGCVGFSSNGVLKSRLLPFENWVHLNSTNEGIYLLDINHCDVNVTEDDSEPCPMNSFCTDLSGGRFSCDMDDDVIHVVISVDKNDSQGLLPLLQSLETHHTKRLLVHVVTSENEREDIQQMISCSLSMTSVFKVSTVGFDVPKNLLDMISIGKEGKQYLKSPANFARFYFDRIFPSLEYIIYLDVDTIVKQDISQLWEDLVKTNVLLLAVKRDRIFHKLLPAVKAIYKRRYHKPMNMTIRGYNAGVYGLNLEKWRNKKLTNEVLYWMKLNKKRKLWYLGTQPIMHIVSYDDWEGIDEHWNVDSLGADTWFKVANESIAEAYILHWSGPYKPWKKTGKHVELWKEYDTGVCNRRGTCMSAENGVARCQCDKGFEGDHCERNVSRA